MGFNGLISTQLEFDLRNISLGSKVTGEILRSLSSMLYILRWESTTSPPGLSLGVLLLHS